MKDKDIKEYIEKVKKKFEKYFVGFSIENENNINIIIDDRDILYMKQKELKNNTLKILNELKNFNLKVKLILVSEINRKNIWRFLGDKAEILDVHALTSFINLKMPKDFMRIYNELPVKFRLSDVKRVLVKISEKDYHRNTYQNWLKSLEKAGFIKLNNRTYEKIEKPYKKELLKPI
jgi:hypothetical protein